MTDATFEKITSSDKPLYGPEKLIVCGFSADVQPKFETVLRMAGLERVPLVWALESQAGSRLSELAALPSGAGQGESSTLPRAIIVAGISEGAAADPHGRMSQNRDETGSLGNTDTHV